MWSPSINDAMCWELNIKRIERNALVRTPSQKEVENNWFFSLLLGSLL